MAGSSASCQSWSSPTRCLTTSRLARPGRKPGIEVCWEMVSAALCRNGSYSAGERSTVTTTRPRSIFLTVTFIAHDFLIDNPSSLAEKMVNVNHETRQYFMVVNPVLFLKGA